MVRGGTIPQGLLRRPMNASAQLPETQTTVSPSTPCQYMVSSQNQSYAKFLGAWKYHSPVVNIGNLIENLKEKLQLWKPAASSPALTVTVDDNRLLFPSILLRYVR